MKTLLVYYHDIIHSFGYCEGFFIQFINKEIKKKKKLLIRKTKNE